MNEQVIKILDKAGARPAGSELEQIAAYETDTLIYKGIQTLTEEKLFDQNHKKHPYLRTNSLPLPRGQVFQAYFARVTHNLRFKDPKHLEIFEKFSKLSYEIESKKYPAIPLNFLLPYERLNYGGSEVNTYFDANLPTTGLKAVEKFLETMPKAGSLFKFPEPITAPHQGNIDWGFIPGGKNLETLDSANYGVKFGTGVATDDDSAVGFIKIDLIGVLTRVAY